MQGTLGLKDGGDRLPRNVGTFMRVRRRHDTSVNTYQTTRCHHEHNCIGIQRFIRLGDISGPVMSGPSNLSFRV